MTRAEMIALAVESAYGGPGTRLLQLSDESQLLCYIEARRSAAMCYQHTDPKSWARWCVQSRLDQLSNCGGGGMMGHRWEDTTHACPVTGCGVKHLRYNLLMCAAHWRLLDKEMQQAVYAAWNDGNPLPGYSTIRQAAIDELNRDRR